MNKNAHGQDLTPLASFTYTNEKLPFATYPAFVVTFGNSFFYPPSHHDL